MPMSSSRRGHQGGHAHLLLNSESIVVKKLLLGVLLTNAFLTTATVFLGRGDGAAISASSRESSLLSPNLDAGAALENSFKQEVPPPPLTESWLMALEDHDHPFPLRSQPPAPRAGSTALDSFSEAFPRGMDIEVMQMPVEEDAETFISPSTRVVFTKTLGIAPRPALSRSGSVGQLSNKIGDSLYSRSVPSDLHTIAEAPPHEVEPEVVDRTSFGLTENRFPLTSSFLNLFYEQFPQSLFVAWHNPTAAGAPEEAGSSCRRGSREQDDASTEFASPPDRFSSLSERSWSRESSSSSRDRSFSCLSAWSADDHEFEVVRPHDRRQGTVGDSSSQKLQLSAVHCSSPPSSSRDSSSYGDLQLLASGLSEDFRGDESPPSPNPSLEDQIQKLQVFLEEVGAGAPPAAAVLRGESKNSNTQTSSPTTEDPAEEDPADGPKLRRSSSRSARGRTSKLPNKEDRAVLRQKRATCGSLFSPTPSDKTATKIANFVDALRNTDRILVLTGAGASVESGIPTFEQIKREVFSVRRKKRHDLPEAENNQQV